MLLEKSTTEFHDTTLSLLFGNININPCGIKHGSRKNKEKTGDFSLSLQCDGLIVSNRLQSFLIFERFMNSFFNSMGFFSGNYHMAVNSFPLGHTCHVPP